jgi:hypothetical protein
MTAAHTRPGRGCSSRAIPRKLDGGRHLTSTTCCPRTGGRRSHEVESHQ